MHHYSYKEIVNLEKSDPNKYLRLHWEGVNSEPAKVTPSRIIHDIKDGHYTPYEFDEFCCCISEDEYRKYQEEQRLESVKDCSLAVPTQD
ncbi:hypothetical protein QTU67_000694 [Vibrio cholerae]|nr:hypothetical protein [Vibrio cholerae]EMC8143432.1 hypothetical protein [Vibrio cholerae]